MPLIELRGKLRDPPSRPSARPCPRGLERDARCVAIFRALGELECAGLKRAGARKARRADSPSISLSTAGSAATRCQCSMSDEPGRGHHLASPIDARKNSGGSRGRPHEHSRFHEASRRSRIRPESSTTSSRSSSASGARWSRTPASSRNNEREGRQRCAHGGFGGDISLLPRRAIHCHGFANGELPHAFHCIPTTLLRI